MQGIDRTARPQYRLITDRLNWPMFPAIAVDHEKVARDPRLVALRVASDQTGQLEHHAEPILRAVGDGDDLGGPGEGHMRIGRGAIEVGDIGAPRAAMFDVLVGGQAESVDMSTATVTVRADEGEGDR